MFILSLILREHRGKKITNEFCCTSLILSLPRLASPSSYLFFKELTICACQEGRFTMTTAVFLNLFLKKTFYSKNMLLHPQGFSKCTPERKQIKHFLFLSLHLPNQARPQPSALH